MGIHLIEGRTWDVDARRAALATPRTSPDQPDLSWVLDCCPVVINAAMARKFWPGESALGKIFFPDDRDP